MNNFNSFTVGAIVGAILRYGVTGTRQQSLHFTVTNITMNDLSELPVNVYLNVPNVSESFKYVFDEPMARHEAESSLQDYAEKATFDPETFFNVLLPPIIFHAGYNMKAVSGKRIS